MTRLLLTLYLLSTLFSVSAKSTSEWLTLLRNSKQKFYQKDTIAIQTDKQQFNIFSTGHLNKVPLDHCKRFFSLDTSVCTGDGHFFYSYYLSTDNYATLTFLSQGKFTNYLTLYNYSPDGEILYKIILEGSSVDAGSGNYVKTSRKDNKTYIVTACEPGDYIENCLEEIFVINSKGQFNKIEQRNFKRNAK